MTDVCVIGAGPAGILLAGELGRHCRVMLLERGESEWNRQAGAVTAVNAGIHYDVSDSRVFAFGGTTNKWEGLPRRGIPTWGEHFAIFPSLDEEDFVRREWVPHSGWPFEKAQLDPFYSRARSLLGCVSLPACGEDICGAEPKNPFLDSQGVLNEKVVFWAKPEVFTEDLKREFAVSDNVTVVTNSTVVDIRGDDSPSSVSSVRAVTDQTHGFSVGAPLFVLATGGIENARLLLSSHSSQPRGLGNAHDLVGRFFMEHPFYMSSILKPDNGALLANHANYAPHLHANLPVQKIYALNESEVRKRRLLRSCFSFEAQPINTIVRRLYYSESATRALRAGANLQRVLAGQGSSLSISTSEEIKHAVLGMHHIARFGFDRVAHRVGQRLRLRRNTSPQVLRIDVMAEQAPNPESRVELSDARDSFGVPVGRLNWQLTDQDLDSFHRSQELFDQALQSAGHRWPDSFIKPKSLPPRLRGGHHHMGTTRMDDSPRRGVVDRNCLVHGVDNLYVAGSSSFPTSGYANPTLTILAMAFRLAEQIKKRINSRAS